MSSINLRDNINLDGVFVSDRDFSEISDAIIVGSGERPLEFFTHSLNKLYLYGYKRYNFWNRCIGDDSRMPNGLAEEVKCAFGLHEQINSRDNASRNGIVEDVSIGGGGLFSQEDMG